MSKSLRPCLSCWGHLGSLSIFILEPSWLKNPWKTFLCVNVRSPTHWKPLWVRTSADYWRVKPWWFVSFNYQSTSGIGDVALKPGSRSPPQHSSSNYFLIQSVTVFTRGASTLIRLQGEVRLSTASMEGAQKEAHSKMARWTKWCLFPWQLSASGSETSSPTSSATNMTFDMMKRAFLKVFVFLVSVLVF